MCVVSCPVTQEVHKRWDPIYTDARDRLRKLGDMSYFTAYMSQPKIQLETFKVNERVAASPAPTSPQAGS